MRTKIFLNEGTEIEVCESKGEIKSLISEKIGIEKSPFCGKDSHFIEVTMIIKEKKFVTKGRFIPYQEIIKIEKKVKTDLYFKRILYIYEI